MSIVTIKEYLKSHDPTYHVLLNNHIDQQNTHVMQLVDPDNSGDIEFDDYICSISKSKSNQKKNACICVKDAEQICFI